jgi:ATP-binding protein involved in chromosome partitioning
VATTLDTELLGEVPLDAAVRQGGDLGIPIVISHPDSNAARVFKSVALTIIHKLGQISQ